MTRTIISMVSILIVLAFGVVIAWQVFPDPKDVQRLLVCLPFLITGLVQLLVELKHAAIIR
jgi:hypothetical protein